MNFPNIVVPFSRSAVTGISILLILAQIPFPERDFGRTEMPDIPIHRRSFECFPINFLRCVFVPVPYPTPAAHRTPPREHLHAPAHSLWQNRIRDRRRMRDTIRIRDRKMMRDTIRIRDRNRLRVRSRLRDRSRIIDSIRLRYGNRIRE